jgi:hypothetical protein
MFATVRTWPSSPRCRLVIPIPGRGCSWRPIGPFPPCSPATGCSRSRGRSEQCFPRAEYGAAPPPPAGVWGGPDHPDGTLGACAAADTGVALERCAVVRRVPRDRWATVVAALLDGMALVCATVPPWLRAGDARRLTARARERAAVLVAMGPWPTEATLRLHTEPSAWAGLECGSGLLDARMLDLHVEGTGVRAHARVG